VRGAASVFWNSGIMRRNLILCCAFCKLIPNLGMYFGQDPDISKQQICLKAGNLWTHVI
jgi:hypothetical protein